MITTAPTPAPSVVIVRAPRNRWWIGTQISADLFAGSPSILLRPARRLYVWPHTLGLAGIAVAADTEALDDLRVGLVVPGVWLQGIEQVMTTTDDAGAALLAHPPTAKPPARPRRPGVEATAGAVAAALGELVERRAGGVVSAPEPVVLIRTPVNVARRIPTPAEVFRA